MINNNKIVAIIPARGGSKGIPRKNIRNLCGKPLIAHTIEEARKSNYIDRVIVSTEDSEIASIGKSYGAEIPFLRPIELSQDDTPGIDPIIHCVEWLIENEDYTPDYVICLQCTTPFRNSIQIDEAIKTLIDSDKESLVSLCESDISPYWMKKIENGHIVDFMNDSKFYARRQETPPVYKLNGAIYISRVNNLLQNRNWYTNQTQAFIMNKVTSLDIDDILDFKFAEFLFKEKLNE